MIEVLMVEKCLKILKYARNGIGKIIITKNSLSQGTEKRDVVQVMTKQNNSFATQNKLT